MFNVKCLILNVGNIGNARSGSARFSSGNKLFDAPVPEQRYRSFRPTNSSGGLPIAECEHPYPIMLRGHFRENILEK